MRLLSPLPFAAVLLVSACASAPPPRSVPRPVTVAQPPRAVVAPPVSADWRDWPVTPGDWAYRRDAEGSIAVFGASGGEALLTLRCDRARGILYLSRSGAVGAPLVVRTTTVARTLAVQPTGATPAYGVVAIAPSDALLDALAFSRGRFIVEQAGSPTLVVPAWAEVPRVTEDCRR